MKKTGLIIFFIGICIFVGCGKKEKIDDVQEPVISTEEEFDDSDLAENEIAETELTETEPTEIETEEMSPEDLFKAFCEGQISAEVISFYDDTTYTMEASDFTITSDFMEEDCDINSAVKIDDPVDLDNDGELEYVLSNLMYGDMYFDCKDGKVICFAQGEGTAARCSYTKYDDAYWIVHSDGTHGGRCTYDLVKLNGNLEVVDSFGFGWEDWEDDGIIRYYKDDQDITEEEYNELEKEVFNNE